MENQQQDAMNTLRDIESAGAKARRLSLYKGADVIYMIWGVTWVVCFLVQHFFLDVCIQFGRYSMPAGGLAWDTMVPIAVILSLVFGRRRSAVQTSTDRALWIFWWLLFIYFGVFVFLVSPLIDYSLLERAELQRRMTALICLVPMFAYVVMGLFGYGRYMLWLGLGLAAATVFGIVVIPNWFFLWMAVIGGGGLFTAGIITRQAWRSA